MEVRIIWSSVRHYVLPTSLQIMKTKVVEKEKDEKVVGEKRIKNN